MSRSFPDLTNSVEWNLVSRQSLTAERVGQQWKIRNQTFVIENSFVCAVGIRNTQAKRTWFLGGYASQNLLLGPSSTSIFVAYTQAGRKQIWLDRLNLLIFPKLVSPWILELSFPWWHEQIELEVWRYDGSDLDDLQQLQDVDQRLSAIESKLNSP